MRYRKHIIRALIAAGTIAVLAPGSTAADKDDSGSVYLNVEVGDGLVSGLTEDNFEVQMDGQPVAATLAEPEHPASIAILVEHSQDSSFYASDLDLAVEALVDGMPDGDWYALATFAHTMEIEEDFTKNRPQILAAYEAAGIPDWRDIDTSDALYKLLDIMGRMQGRRILVFVGSGFDTFSSTTQKRLLDKVEESNVTIFAIGAGSMLRTTYEPYLSEDQQFELQRAQVLLNELARKSGGMAWFPRFERDFTDEVKGLVQTLDTQYHLVLPPTGSNPARHRITVKVKDVENAQRMKVTVRPVLVY